MEEGFLGHSIILERDQEDRETDGNREENQFQPFRVVFVKLADDGSRLIHGFLVEVKADKQGVEECGWIWR
jgi:hypothetical protein